jgi:hypothetical protein
LSHPLHRILTSLHSALAFVHYISTSCFNHSDGDFDATRSLSRKRDSPASVPTAKRPKLPKHRNSSIVHQYQHINPPPQPWLHNNCGPGCALEIANTLLRHCPSLWQLLEPATRIRLENIHLIAQKQKQIPSNSYPACPADRCGTHADHCLAQHVYQHMNINRHKMDGHFDSMEQYDWGQYTDSRLLLDHILGLRGPGATPNSQSIPLSQFALQLRTKCHACQTITTNPSLQLLSNDACLTKYKTLTNASMPSTQLILDMYTGHSILRDLLPAEPQALVNELAVFASRCDACETNALLPALVQGQPPPFFQIRQWGEVTIGDLCPTTTLTMADGTQHEYNLIAVMYGGNYN